MVQTEAVASGTGYQGISENSMPIKNHGLITYPMFVIDIDTGSSGFAVAEFPKNMEIQFGTVYRNSDTRRLDGIYGNKLDPLKLFIPKTIDNIPAECESIIEPLARLPNYTGFYFGIPVDMLGDREIFDLCACLDAKAVKIVKYKGTDIVLPRKMKF